MKENIDRYKFNAMLLDYLSICILVHHDELKMGVNFYNESIKISNNLNFLNLNVHES